MAQVKSQESQDTDQDVEILVLSACANFDPGVNCKPCKGNAVLTCSACGLVQYCSKKCQKIHWPVHRADCQDHLRKNDWRPFWDINNQRPAFIDGAYMSAFGGLTYLWGNVPAIDILNLERNEKAEVPDELRLLFAASGDLRNVVRTLSRLPEDYQGQSLIVINDRDLDIVARNAILLLIALSFDTATAATMMIHIWYSAFIPNSILRRLQDKVRSLIQDVCTKIKAKPSGNLLSKKWTFGKRSLRLTLEKIHWDALLLYFELPGQLTTERAKALRTAVTLAPTRRDYRERQLYCQISEWRICIMEFLKDGILLPFGACRKSFDVPNPTFFQNAYSWPLKDNADPLAGWAVREVMQNSLVAKHDMYGALYKFLYQTFTTFCEKLQGLNMDFSLYHLPVTQLPKRMEDHGIGPQAFDRVEISNICDHAYLGAEACLRLFGPLLKPPAKNPHATLIGLFLNALHEIHSDGDDEKKIQPGEFSRVTHYLPISFSTLIQRRPYSAEVLRCLNAHDMFWDFDALFDKYMREERFRDISRKAGLVMKEENTVIDKWPMRLREGATQKEFDVAMASAHTGCERYVEWKWAL